MIAMATASTSDSGSDVSVGDAAKRNEICRLWRCRWLRRLSLLLAAMLALYVARAPLLTAVAAGLVMQPATASADWALVLGGDRCFEQVAQLFHSGTIRGVLLIEFMPSRLVRIGVLPPDEELARRELTKHGVPESAIEVVRGRATSFWEAARNLDSWLADRADDRLIITCARFAGREQQLKLSRVFVSERTERLGWLPLVDRRYDETNWWTRKEGVLDVFNSYASLAYVWINGEQPSTWREWDPDRWLAVQLSGAGN